LVGITEYCPDGYRTYSTRYNWNLGRRIQVYTHQQCADRCTEFSGPEHHGGCKGFMTGMYYGLLYCKSFGGKPGGPCAYWAAPKHRGVASGAFGETYTRTNQENLGGRCCSNVTFKELDNAADVRKAASSSAAPPASISTGLVITITIGALVVLYAVYRGGQVYGAKNTPPNAPQPPPAATTDRNSVAARDNDDGAARDHGANLVSESTHC